MALRDWIPGLGSFDEIRIGNFKQCVSESDGVTLIDTHQRRGAHRVTLLLREESSVSAELLRMFNTPHVRFADFYVEDGKTYIEIEIT